MELKSFKDALVGDKLLLTNSNNGTTVEFIIQAIDVVYRDYKKYKCIHYNDNDLLYVPLDWRASCASTGPLTIQLIRETSNHEAANFADLRSGDAIYIVAKSGITKAYIEAIEAMDNRVVITTDKHQQIPLAKYNLNKRHTKRLSTSLEQAKILFALLYN